MPAWSIIPLAALLAVATPFAVAAQPGVTPPSAKPFIGRTMATLSMPRGMSFLPDGRFVVVEEGGQVWLFAADGRLRQPVAGVPAFEQGSQGGLRDVVRHPNFARNRLIYLSGVQRAGDVTGLVVMIARLAEDRGQTRLEEVRTIFTTKPFVLSDMHYSGKLAFTPKGRFLMVTAGERNLKYPAQDPAGTLGKVMRLLPDGSPAPNNPLAAKGFDPAVWSYGHRNLYGLAFDAAGNLWEHEMGPMGGDEVNLLRPGRNYGWPAASNGSDYDGKDIPDHRPGDGYEPPKVWWNPSISPSGMVIYSGKLFPQWTGDILMGGLGSRSLFRIDLNGTSATKAERWAMDARVREVEEAPDGAIWLLADDGRVIRLAPR